MFRMLKSANGALKIQRQLYMLRNFGQIVKVPLPDLGEGTKEATVKEWYVKPGDRVAEVSSRCLTNLIPV
jgi:hypothetical protein